MSRIRTIKPDFWTDEKVVDLSAFARLLFIGMWNFVDDEGRASFSPRELKMRILPADDVDASALIGEIRRKELIQVYDVEGKEYFAVKGFAEHQKIDKRRASKIPPPPNCADARRIAPNCDPGRKEGNGEEENPSGRDAPNIVARETSPLTDEITEAGVFRLGKAVLGQGAGGVITKLKKHLNHDLKATHDLLQQAKAKENPMEWVQAAMRKPDWRDQPEYRGVQ